MRVENTYLNSINHPRTNQPRPVADAEEIKSILFLGIKSDLPTGDTKRKVDIII